MKVLYKRSFLFVLFVLALGDVIFAQSFYTGGIGVTLSQYGRIRIFSDSLTTRQVDRSSLLVGVSSSAVFDYTEDAENVVAPATVSSPQNSDYEATVTIDNSYSSLPPAVEAEEHIFGWTSGGFAVGKLTVTNNESSAIQAVIGLEIIPEIDGDYASISNSYNSSSQVVTMNSTSYVGYEFFSDALTSMHSFDWFDGYGNDADYFTWLTQNSFDAPFTSGADGSVVIMGSSPVTINSGESYDFYFGIAVGSDESTMTNNMSAAETQYNSSILPVELTSFSASVDRNNVLLKWETATEINNRGFEIERKNGSESNWVTIGFKDGHGTSTDAHSYSYVDNVSNISVSHFSYRLKQVDFDGTFSYSNEVEVNVNSVSSNYSLNQNYPNPFNPSTIISFSLPAKDFVTLKVYNLLGEEVGSLISKEMEAGNYSFNFQSENLPSGIYLYTLTAGKFKDTKKMILLR
jgi:Secretion system C-terminal sorting domain